MAWSARILRRLGGKRFRREEEGAVLVEFGIVFPVMLLLLFVMIEAGRLLWAYQIAVEGVREASRYLARTAPVDICLDSTNSLAGRSGEMATIIGQAANGDPFFDQFITVNTVTAAHTCVTTNT